MGEEGALSKGAEQLQNTQIVREIANQIAKDFAEFSLDIQFSNSKATAYEELQPQVLAAVEKLLENNFERLMALLYRIDVSERKLSASEVLRPGDALAIVITDLIIERELQKVVLRMRFS